MRNSTSSISTLYIYCSISTVTDWALIPENTDTNTQSGVLLGCIIILKHSPHFSPPHLCSYRSYPLDVPARLTAGVDITALTTESIKSPSLLRLLPSHARNNIVQVDVHTQSFNSLKVAG